MTPNTIDLIRYPNKGCLKLTSWMDLIRLTGLDDSLVLSQFEWVRGSKKRVRLIKSWKQKWNDQKLFRVIRQRHSTNRFARCTKRVCLQSRFWCNCCLETGFYYSNAIRFQFSPVPNWGACLSLPSSAFPGWLGCDWISRNIFVLLVKITWIALKYYTALYETKGPLKFTHQFIALEIYLTQLVWDWVPFRTM